MIWKIRLAPLKKNNGANCISIFWGKTGIIKFEFITISVHSTHPTVYVPAMDFTILTCLGIYLVLRVEVGKIEFWIFSPTSHCGSYQRLLFFFRIMGSDIALVAKH